MLSTAADYLDWQIDMRKFLLFEDGEEIELPPISYDEFTAIDLWRGASDSEYAKWLSHNGYVEAEDYKDAVLLSASIRISLEPIPVRKFEFSEDSGETWKSIDTLNFYRGHCLSLKPEEKRG